MAFTALCREAGNIVLEEDTCNLSLQQQGPSRAISMRYSHNPAEVFHESLKNVIYISVPTIA